MSAHTRTNIETMDYECAMRDCGHEVRPCPSTTTDACKECSDRSWAEYEGGVVTWDECAGEGRIWVEQDLDDACLDEFDLPPGSTEQ